MSVLYNQFCITSVKPDLKTKTIVVTTNFKIDASTVNFKTVSLYHYEEDGSQLAEYSLSVDNKSICIILNEYPPTETRFFLKVTDIYDALNRKINYNYGNYVIFNNDVITDITVLSPGYRETFTENIIGVKLGIKDALESGSYRIQVSSDNAFFNIISTVTYNATSKELETSGDELTISDSNLSESEITFSATVNYNGQLFIRARAEKSETELGRWSETIPFTINTIPVDSMDTTFLDQALTTYDLFAEELTIAPLAVSEKSHVSDITDGAFYMEFNKAIKLNQNEYVLKKNIEKLAKVSLDDLINLKTNLTYAEYNLKSGVIKDPLTAYELAFFGGKVC